MKKAKTKRRGAVSKAKSPPRNFQEYLARIPKAAHGHLKKMRTAIRSVIPREATEIISYGIPAFKGKKVLVWFAGLANHCSLFPTAAVIDEFKGELKPFSTSKGTIHFPLDKPLPIALIKRILKARVGRAAGI